MSEEKTISKKTAYHGRAVKVRSDVVLTPDGRETTREVVEHPDCVAIIAVDGEGNLLLERQFRHAVDKELLEIPAGGIEPGEEPEEAVRREMREETGYLPRRVERLGGFYSVPGYGTEYLYLYLATDLESSPLTAEDTAEISLVRASPREVRKLIASGKIEDSKSIAGLLFYLDSREP